MPLYNYRCDKCKYSKSYQESLSQTIVHYCGNCKVVMHKELGECNYYKRPIQARSR